MLTLNKPYYDGHNGRFIVTAIAGETATVFFPASTSMRDLPVAEVEAMKAAGDRRTYFRGGEMRVLINTCPPEPEPEEDMPDRRIWPDGVVQYCETPGGMIHSVATPVWLAWRDQLESAPA